MISSTFASCSGVRVGCSEAGAYVAAESNGIGAVTGARGTLTAGVALGEGASSSPHAVASPARATAASTRLRALYMALDPRPQLLQRNVPVLLGGVAVDLVLEHFESADELDAGFARVDNVVDEAAGGGDVGVGEV